MKLSSPAMAKKPACPRCGRSHAPEYRTSLLERLSGAGELGMAGSMGLGYSGVYASDEEQYSLEMRARRRLSERWARMGILRSSLSWRSRGLAAGVSGLEFVSAGADAVLRLVRAGSSSGSEHRRRATWRRSDEPTGLGCAG